MLDTIKQKVIQYESKQLDLDLPDAAVLIAITESEEPEMILTLRSGNLSKHAGEVAFPGGKMDQTDKDLEFTALREAHEEVGIVPKQANVLGALDQVASRLGMRVTPYVATLPADITLIANPDEIDSIFRVPVRFFLENDPVKITDIRFLGQQIDVPGFYYDDYKIWGLTAFIICDFMRAVFDRTIDFSLPREEKRDD